MNNLQVSRVDSAVRTYGWVRTETQLRQCWNHSYIDELYTVMVFTA